MLGQADISDRMPGLTPLSWAAKGGHEEVVRMLLERDDLDLNAADGRGRTPLRSGQQGA